MKGVAVTPIPLRPRQPAPQPALRAHSGSGSQTAIPAHTTGPTHAGSHTAKNLLEASVSVAASIFSSLDSRVTPSVPRDSFPLLSSSISSFTLMLLYAAWRRKLELIKTPLQGSHLDMSPPVCVNYLLCYGEMFCLPKNLWLGP